MAQVLIRNIEKPLMDRLKKRAKAEGRSLEAHVRGVLEGAAERTPAGNEGPRRLKRPRVSFKKRPT